MLFRSLYSVWLTASFAALFLFYSCSEEYDLKLNSVSKIVVEGYLDDQEGPYFIKISSTKGQLDYSKLKVSISDNEGNIDVLKKLDHITHKDEYGTWLMYPNYNNGFDSMHLEPMSKDELLKIYHTTHIIGKIGNTYTLKVDYGGSSFSASEKMLPVPVIDSLLLYEESSEDFKKDEMVVPYIYFKKLDTGKNFFLFDYGFHPLQYLSLTSVSEWWYSVLDDSFLPEYVNGFWVDNGFGPRDRNSHHFTRSVTIKMSSISENAYKYFDCLLNQFYNDGGAYSPAPASPPSNMSGSALGYFRVSASSMITSYFED